MLSNVLNANPSKMLKVPGTRIAICNKEEREKTNPHTVLRPDLTIKDFAYQNSCHFNRGYHTSTLLLTKKRSKQRNQPIAKLQLLDITLPHLPSVPTGLNEHLIGLKTLAIFADRSQHITSSMMKEKYQGKTTSATQPDTIAITMITERSYALIPSHNS